MHVFYRGIFGFRRSCFLSIPYARDKTAVDLFHFSLFCLWSIREGGLFKEVVYLVNLPAGKLAAKKEHQLFVLLCSNQSVKKYFFAVLCSNHTVGVASEQKINKSYLLKSFYPLSLAVRYRSIQEGGLFH